MVAMKMRPATSEDVSLIFSLLQEKVEYDRNIGVISGEVPVTEDKIRQALFGDTTLSHVFFAEQGGREVGFALYAFRFHSYEGRPSLWLEDLFVDEKMRGQGVADAMMAHLAKIASEHHCSHIGWHADARNIIGLKFYRRLGAEITENFGNNRFFKWVPSGLS